MWVLIIFLNLYFCHAKLHASISFFLGGGALAHTILKSSPINPPPKKKTNKCSIWVSFSTSFNLRHFPKNKKTNAVYGCHFQLASTYTLPARKVKGSHHTWCYQSSRNQGNLNGTTGAMVYNSQERIKQTKQIPVRCVQNEWLPTLGGVLNFHFGIGVGPEGPEMGA